MAWNFQLASRTLSIDANREIVEKSVAAIKKAGYKPEPIVTEGPEISVPKKEDRVYHLWLALTIAIAVEILDFAGGDLLSVKIGGMALSAVAIWLSGFTTYRKGLAALMQRRFNINALMTVAVTGAFLIGQWPEAAMVMALYAIAELIEARSVDRARNAIRNLLDLTPPTAEVRNAEGIWTGHSRQGCVSCNTCSRPSGRPDSTGRHCRKRSWNGRPVAGDRRKHSGR